MSQKGNAFFYILVAVVLFAGLTFTISRSNLGSTPVTEINQGRETVAGNAIISYSVQAQNAVTRLDQMGTGADQIDFILPSNAAFNTAPTLNKFYHPDGGGFALKPLPGDAAATVAGSPTAGFYVGRFNNFDWTPTTAQDVVFTAYGLSSSVCALINKQLTGSTTIPTVTGQNVKNVLVDTAIHSAGNAGLTTTNCAACDEKPALCITDGTVYGFYSILVAR